MIKKALRCIVNEYVQDKPPRERNKLIMSKLCPEPIDRVNQNQLPVITYMPWFTYLKEQEQRRRNRHSRIRQLFVAFVLFALLSI